MQPGENDSNSSREHMHVPEDADEFYDGLVSILMRIPDNWGRRISCNKGWYPTLVATDRLLAELDPNYTVHQVKEKFGGLRYYYQPTEAVNDEVRREMRRVVAEAEACG